MGFTNVVVAGVCKWHSTGGCWILSYRSSATPQLQWMLDWFLLGKMLNRPIIDHTCLCQCEACVYWPSWVRKVYADVWTTLQDCWTAVFNWKFASQLQLIFDLLYKWTLIQSRWTWWTFFSAVSVYVLYMFQRCWAPPRRLHMFAHNTWRINAYSILLMFVSFDIHPFRFSGY